MRCPYDVAHIAGVHAVRADRQRQSFATLLVLLAEAREAPILLVGLFNGR